MGGHEQLCLECGEPFAASRSDAITCSNACRSRRGRRMRWKQVGNMRFRTVEAQPDDPMFNRMHVAFFSDPGPADDVAKGKVNFRGSRPADLHEPWTIHLRPKQGASSKPQSKKSAPGEQEVRSMVTQSPYVHSPEEGTPEAEQQPWRIHVPLGPEAEVDSPPEENRPPED